MIAMAFGKEGMTAREEGFTLVELLVALTLFGVLTTMLFMEFRLGIRSADKVTEAIDKSSTLPILHDFLRAQLAAAQPIVRNGSSEEILWFDGQAEKVEFIGMPPNALSGVLSGGGLQRFSIELLKAGGPPSVGSGPSVGGAPRDGGRRLVLRRRLYQGKQFKAEGDYDEPLVLLADVASFQFGYFGAADPARAPAWQDTWREMPRLPSLIRLRLALVDGRQMPDLVVALRLAEGAGPRPFSQNISR
jgi:general secretion pathway protein J